MTAVEDQRIGYFLTPEGCRATGGHVRGQDGHCVVCRERLGAPVEAPADMLERALTALDSGADPQRLVDVAIAHRDKWARLVEEQASGVALDGRASIYTGETYVEARDRWQAYLDLLNAHLADVEGGLSA